MSGRSPRSKRSITSIRCVHKKLREYGAVDVLFHTQTISETSRANLFFVKEGQVYTPASHILKGITRKQVLSIVGNIRVEDIEAGRLYDFDEMFLTSTSRDVTPVVSVEGKRIGNGTPGPVTREIQAAFHTKGWSPANPDAGPSIQTDGSQSCISSAIPVLSIAIPLLLSSGLPVFSSGIPVFLLRSSCFRYWDTLAGFS